jgi:hypothetical protein
MAFGGWSYVQARDSWKYTSQTRGENDGSPGRFSTHLYPVYIVFGAHIMCITIKNKKWKKSYMLFSYFHLCIKFKFQIFRIKEAVKKTIFEISKLINMSEISLFSYI